MSDAAPAISVVVPTRDRRDRLAAALRSLSRQSLPAHRFEVVVVDDGSVDGSAEAAGAVAAKLPIEVRIHSAGGTGPAAARNRGWREARAPLIAFTDDDCEADEDWLASLHDAAARHPGAILQGRTEPNPRELGCAAPFSRTKRIEGPSPFFQTCNVAYPRKLLDWLGGFDERFTGAAGEDADLGWRALELGAERVFVDTAVAFHAVERLGPVGFLRSALAGSESAHAYRRHRGLRAEACYARIFWARSHARLALAIAGLLAARRRPVAVALAAPYGKGLLGRARSQGAVWTIPFLVAHDVLAVTKAARGGISARILLL